MLPLLVTLSCVCRQCHMSLIEMRTTFCSPEHLELSCACESPEDMFKRKVPIWYLCGVTRDSAFLLSAQEMLCWWTAGHSWRG